MSDVVPFFAVPFGFAKLEDRGTLNAELRKLCLERATDGDRYANPRPITRRNAQIFESNFEFFRWPEACVQRLKGLCWDHLFKFICEINGYDQTTRDRLLLYSDAWFHVTRRGGYFALHNHPMASWSGVYCVDPGKSDSDCPDSGLLSFLNPSLGGSMYLDPANTNLQGAFSHGIRSLRLEAGQLVMFPAWVLHEVKPFEGEGERITVAFNAWFALKDPS